MTKSLAEMVREISRRPVPYEGLSALAKARAQESVRSASAGKDENEGRQEELHRSSDSSVQPISSPGGND